MGEMDPCVPTSEIPIRYGVEVKEMPRLKAVCVTHIGSYETLYKACEAIDQYAEEHNLQLQLPFREIFIKGRECFLRGILLIILPKFCFRLRKIKMASIHVENLVKKIRMACSR
jgi:hypothetical protein